MYQVVLDVGSASLHCFSHFIFNLPFLPFPQVEFAGEEGTGLGPSLEFYALVAAELQCRSLGMWLCDDDFPVDQSREVSHQFSVVCEKSLT